MPLEVFYSYSHKDEELRRQLETHLALLQRNGLILPWNDRCLGAGEEWANQIDEHLRTAQIILLLISPDFLASNYCFDLEMKAALERHAQGQAIVIPIVLRPCDWSGAPFAGLQALPRDAKAVTLWPNQDEAFAEIAKAIRETVVRFQQPAAALPGVNPLADQAKPKARVLDAALPTHIVKDRATELLVLIRLPDSKGLMGILQDDEEAEARPEDVRSKPFEVTFPQGPTGAPEPLKVTVALTSPDFSPPSQRKNIFVPVNADSEVCPFLLTPMRMGLLTVAIELVWEDAERGYRRLRTNCVAEAELPSVKPLLNVVRVPMGVAGEEGTVTFAQPGEFTRMFGRPNTGAVAPGAGAGRAVPQLSERGGSAATFSPAGAPPQRPVPAVPTGPHGAGRQPSEFTELFMDSLPDIPLALRLEKPRSGEEPIESGVFSSAGSASDLAPVATSSPAAKRSIFSSAGFKVAAMAFVVVTAGTVFFQNSTTAPKPSAGAPAAAPPVSAAAPAETTEIAPIAEEFRKASEPFSQANRVDDPEAAAAIKEGQENLTAARMELAKGNKQKAEEYLKLVRAASARLQKK